MFFKDIVREILLDSLGTREFIYKTYQKFRKPCNTLVNSTFIPLKKSCKFCHRLSEEQRRLYKKIVRDFVAFKLKNCLPSEKGLLTYIKDSKWCLTINFICESASLQGHTLSCIADKMGLTIKTFRTYIKHADYGFALTAKGEEVIERSGVASLPASVILSHPAPTYTAPPPTAPLIPQHAIAPCLRTAPLVSHADLLMPFFAMLQRQLLTRAYFSTAIPISPYPTPLMPYLIMPQRQSTAPVLPTPSLAPLSIQPRSLKRKSDEINNPPGNLQSWPNTSPTKFRKLEERTGRI